MAGLKRVEELRLGVFLVVHQSSPTNDVVLAANHAPQTAAAHVRDFAYYLELAQGISPN